MKVNTAMILAGGKGTRFKEQTQTVPKPMIKANGKPLLLYIIEHYMKFGVENYIVLSGYKSENIVDYFANVSRQVSKSKFVYNDFANIHVLYTGLNSMTGWRVKQGIKEVNENEFFLTYGDGISNIDISKLYKFHKKNNKLSTVTAVRPPARFGSLKIENNLVKEFGEKSQADQGWINGGYFVINKKIDKYLKHDKKEIFERNPLENLAKKNQLSAYYHEGYWQPVDTIRELEILENYLKKQMMDKIFGLKKVLITGHTGFKGSWLANMLNSLHAEVHGLSNTTNPGIYEMTDSKAI